MRTTFIATVSAFILMAAPALAQTASTPTSRTPDPNVSISAPPLAARMPAPDPLKMEDISKISGSAVYGSDDKKIGSISTILMTPKSKTIDRFVVNAGGVLGVGGHKVAMPIAAFTWDSDKGAFKVAKTEDDVKSMPEWRSETARAVE